MAIEYKLSFTASDINAKLQKIDSLADKDEIPSKISELTNDSGFATESYVNDSITTVSEDVSAVSALVGNVAVSEQISSALNESAVLYSTAQELTDEQKAQARANIEAIDADMMLVKSLPILRTEVLYAGKSYETHVSYVNVDEMEDCTLYALRGRDDTKTHQTKFVFVCDDGTEKSIVSKGSTGVCYVEFAYSSDGSIVGVILQFENEYHRLTLTDRSTANNVVLTSVKLTDYIPTTNSIEYTPTQDYHPATKKYVDSFISAIPAQAQPDWSQTDETAVDFIKNKPEIATDDEIIEMLTQEDMFPVVVDTDGSILADENNNILLW